MNKQGFTSDLAAKTPLANAGDMGDMSSISGLEDALEKKMVTHSSILAWKITRTEEPGGLQSMGSQRVRHNLATKQKQQ